MTAYPIATRVFTIDGQSVECAFFKPELSEIGFGCRYEIAWPEGLRSRTVFGVDAVQALVLAMQSAHTDLLVAREKDGRQVAWLKQKSLGMPVAKPIADWTSDGET